MTPDSLNVQLQNGSPDRVPGFAGDSDMARRIRELDWAATPLGSVESWPQSLRTTLEIMLRSEAQIVLFWGPEFVALYNDAYAPTIGTKHPYALGRPAREYWIELWDDLEPLLRGVRETGQTFTAKDRPFYIERHGGGEQVSFDVSYSAVPAADGSISGVLCIVAETTERLRAQAALRESEERQGFLLQLSDRMRVMSDPVEIQTAALRSLAEWLDLSRAGYYELQDDQDIFALTARWERGVDPFPVRLRLSEFGEDVRDTYLAGRTLVMRDTDAEASSESAREAFRAIQARAGIGVPLIKHGRFVTALAVHYRRPRDWTPAEIRLVEDVAERTWSAAERARTDAALRESEGRLKVLVAELQHRTRNLIAVVGAIADRTGASSTSLEEFHGRYSERLGAIARAQGLLSSSDQGERVAFDEVLQAELSAVGWRDDQSGRVTLDGPRGIPLLPRTVQTFALALHELAINALKYGALRAPDGRLTVNWRIEDAADQRCFRVEWRESGVVMPGPDAPSQGGGYGRELIERALPYQLGASTRYVMGADGVHCTIVVPVVEAIATDGKRHA